MAQRLHANKRAAAGRGELRTPLPVGYVHDDADDIVLDPDAGVQAAIRDVFAAFTASGSAYGVIAAFAGRRFPHPRPAGYAARCPPRHLPPPPSTTVDSSPPTPFDRKA